MAGKQLGSNTRPGDSHGSPTSGHGLVVHEVGGEHGQQGAGYHAGKDRPGQTGGGGEPGVRSVGGGGHRQSGSKGHNSWAEMLSSTLTNNSWNKNVLECVLEKDERGSFYVSEKDCARMMQKVGLDIRPGIHVETVQICPNGRGIILITLKKEVQIDQFCRYDIFDVTSTGIRVVNIKPSGKREVIVNIKNIHPNTMDDSVVDYLNKFGEVVSKKVVYGLYGEGPLKGFKNGDRAFKMEIKPGVNIGTYHVLDGQKVTLKYPGQLQTCARCHQTAKSCLGRGMAKRCEEAKGEKVEFGDYIRNLWNQIGYSPRNGATPTEVDSQETDEGYTQQEGGKFTPKKASTDNSDKFAGVSIKYFPKEVDHSQIVDLLVESGLPTNNMQDIDIKTNGSVSIRSLENEACLAMIKALHNKLHFGRKLFCNGIIPCTPEKTLVDTESTESSPCTGAPPSPGTTAVTTSRSDVPSPCQIPSTSSISGEDYCSNQGQSESSTSTTSPATITATSFTPTVQCLSPLAVLPPALAITEQLPIHSKDIVTPTQVYTAPQVSPNSSYNSPPSQIRGRLEYSPPNQSLLELGTSTDIQQFIRENQINLDDELVRRHSLSLRTPPPGSLAAEILEQQSNSATPHFTIAKTLLNNLTEMTSKISDFESCVSSADDERDSDADTKSEDHDEKSMIDKKRHYKQKRKHSTTPNRDFFLKKPNTSSSPNTQ